MILFLDVNAHLPLHPKALEAYINFNNSIAGYGNAMGKNLPARSAASELEKARDKIAKLIGAKSNQIFFTSSGTQACEWGLEILKSQNFTKVFTSTIEHKSVAEKSINLFGNNDLLVNKQGIIFCEFTPPGNSAFVCIYIQNEIGTIQPIENIKVPFFSDISQAVGKIPIDLNSVNNLKIAAVGAHKFGGPTGIGILYLQDPKWWKPFGTGSRYNFDRPATPDTGMIIATAVALEQAILTLPRRYENALIFRDILENFLLEKNMEIIGSKANRSPYTTFFKVGNKMAPYIMSQLEVDNIYVGLGSACGSLHSSTNPIMTALGHNANAQDYLRISQWGDYREKQAMALIKALKKYT